MQLTRMAHEEQLVSVMQLSYTRHITLLQTHLNYNLQVYLILNALSLHFL